MGKSPDEAVRYGRVPKKSREAGNSAEEMNVCVNSTTPTQVSQLSSCGSQPTPAIPVISASNNNNNNSNNNSNTSSSNNNSNSVTGAGAGAMANCAEISTSSSNILPDSMTYSAPELSIYDIINYVAHAYRGHIFYTTERQKELTRISLADYNEQNPSKCKGLAATDDPRVWLWQEYASRATPAVQRIVEFAKRIPGFIEFPPDDQLILIKLGFFEVWLTHVSRGSSESFLMFDDGVYLTRQQMEVIYDVEYVNDLFSLMAGLNSCCLSDTEIGLYSALILMTDRPGLTDTKAILKTREYFAEALRVQITRSRPNAVSALQIMPALEAKIHELRTLGEKHFTYLEWFRINWESDLLPALFAEIFDVPKSEEDSQQGTG